MRGTLTPSKPAEQRRRRNAPAHAEQVVTDHDDLLGPPLPGAGWSDYAHHYYDTWRRSPQAQLFEATDWQRLHLVMVALEAYMRRPGAALLSEIRLNEERLGATVTDRMRARIVIDRDDRDDEPVALAVVKDIRADITARLQGSIEEGSP